MQMVRHRFRVLISLCFFMTNILMLSMRNHRKLSVFNLAVFISQVSEKYTELLPEWEQTSGIT